MKTTILLPWINAGYKTFAFDGPTELKVERLAQAVGKNKSSFYHHFSSMDFFVEQLLIYHLEQAKVMAVKEEQCTTQAELIAIIVEHKIDLLFNRQLRIHRQNPDFEACFLKTNELTRDAIMGVWSHILGLPHQSYLAELVLNLSLENFYLQITDQTIHPDWLNQYFSQLQSLIRAFKANETKRPIKR